MKRALAVVLLAIGCGAQMVNAPGASSASSYAPVNEAQRGGVVKYLNQGAGFVVRGRRDDAYRQMYTACAGPYRIDAEGPQDEGSVTQFVSMPYTGPAAFTSSQQFWYIRFSCVR